MSVSLHSILEDVGLPIPAGVVDKQVRSVSCDSRSVRPGALFIGLPGLKFDGGTFWPQMSQP